MYPTSAREAIYLISGNITSNQCSAAKLERGEPDTPFSMRTISPFSFDIMRILPKSSVQAAKLPSGESTTDSACLRLSGKPYLKKRKPPDKKILVLIRYIRVPNVSSIVLSTMKNLFIDGH